MRRAHGFAASMVALLSVQTGCYRTHVVTNLRPEATVHEDRQWFTAAGLVPVSKPAGEECRNGVAWAQSRATPVDVLIQAGLIVAGTVIGAGVCAGGGRTDEERGNCAAIGGLIPALLVGSRTVAYACVADSAPSFMPQGTLRPGEVPVRAPADTNAPAPDLGAPATPTPPPLPPSGAVPETSPGL
jgi:hypothetical protein